MNKSNGLPYLTFFFLHSPFFHSTSLIKYKKNYFCYIFNGRNEEALSTLGGLANWLSDFLTLIFIIPYAGPSITTIILTITAYLLGRTIQPFPIIV